MEYIGERLWVGDLGNLLVIIAFVASGIATLSYYLGTSKLDDSWTKLGRNAFRVHSVAVISLVVTLLLMLFNRYFEFHYVWQHSSSALPPRYLLSAFWEGQEGSFLLWTIWHVVLGNILTKTAKSWEAPVMTVISSVQFLLTSMVLGIYILDFKVGSNPFTVLLREHPDFMNIPVFTQPDYLEKIDGRGLNPLLQNYWMTIHPPTLFLGFALTVVPFAYAVAGLWKGKYTEWIKPALPWTFVGIMVLGIGILMGGAWAYEALSFGGFWAWDPVENASLVPWIILVAGGHVMLIQQSKKVPSIIMFVLMFLSFILVLYSTFLTRSGVLGESSVHAFTDLGMYWQLMAFLFIYVLLGAAIIARHFKRMPSAKDEDQFLSREFWMFIGSLILVISSFQIAFYTSIPVINEVFGTDLAPPTDAIAHYNMWQTPFAVIITILMGFGLFLKWKKTDGKSLLQRIGISTAIAIFIGGIIAYLYELTNLFHCLLLFGSVFSVVGNVDYFARVLKGKLKNAGAAVAHVGFGLIMLGALLSTGKSETISANTSGVDISKLGEEGQYNNQENIMLYKYDTLKMGNYFISYRGKTHEGVNINYEVEYFTQDEAGKYNYEFTLYPRIQTNPMMGNVAEPDTKHFLEKDIYTHVTYAVLDDPKKQHENHNHAEDADKYLPPSTYKMKLGDSVWTNNSIIILDSLKRDFDKEKMGVGPRDLILGAQIRVLDLGGNTYKAMPLYVLTDSSMVYAYPDFIDELGLKFKFGKVLPKENKMQISIMEKKDNRREFIVMKAKTFPMINILWIGCLLFMFGTILATRRRIKQLKNAN